jgi:ketosteroid isomerase-like protein
MKTHPTLLFAMLLLTLVSGGFAEDQAVAQPSDMDRLRELDAYWAEVSRAVGAGDFEGYKATCHEQGVLVTGIKKTSEPLAKALAQWKPGFDDTRAGKMKASVTFRFSTRLGDADTAHETGIFLYTAETAAGKRTEEYIHLEALLTKQQGKWKTLMEYQKSKATKKEWDKLE